MSKYKIAVITGSPRRDSLTVRVLEDGSRTVTRLGAVEIVPPHIDRTPQGLSVQSISPRCGEGLDLRRHIRGYHVAGTRVLRVLAATALAILPTIADAQNAPINIPPDSEVSDAPILRHVPTAPAPIVLPPVPGGRQSLAITRVAHATVLIDFAGKTVLTDPWFTEAPDFHHGEPLAMGVDDLPRLSAVVASHAHYDHFDIERFARYRFRDVPLLVGFADMADRARKAGFTDVRMVKPSDEVEIDGIHIVVEPGAHGVPEVTYLLRAGGNSVYFGGDTLLTPEVRAIAAQGRVDVALLPINGLRVMGEPVVMTADQAAVFADILGAAVVIPQHYRFYGGIRTEGSLLTYDGTPAAFARAAVRAAPHTRVRILEPGEVQRFQ